MNGWGIIPIRLCISGFAFVADRNVFVDAYLVSGAENGYKSKF